MCSEEIVDWDERYEVRSTCIVMQDESSVEVVEI
jgi:hypothetical protein